MTFSENPARSNKSGHLYTKGSKDVDGSIRLSINPFSGIARIEERKDGIWSPASFETDSASVWVGPRVGIGGAGCNLITEDSDGSFNLFAHNDFDGELSTSDTHILDVYEFRIREIVVSDDSGEFTGTEYTYNYPSPDHRMLRKAYYRTGAIAATKPIRLQVWEGVDNTGPIVFDRTYPASIFIANSEIQITAEGFVEFEKDKNYYVMLSSENSFSLKTTLDLQFPWTAGDISLVRKDDILQAVPYEDGETYTQDQWAIQGKKVYVCNVTGVQNGTFEDNSDKWDVLEAGSGLVLGETGTTAYRGDRGKIAYDHVSEDGKNHSDVVLNNAKRTYPLSDENKLSGIESGAEVNQSDSEIKTQYENNADTNAFTDSEKSKLSGIEENAEANVQSDWNQADSGADDYIKNKPAISGLTSFEAKAANTITNTSLTDVLATGMSLIPGAGDYLIWFSTVLENSDNETTYVSIYVNGVKDDASERRWENESSIPNTPSTVATNGRALGLEAGQAIEIRWRTTNNTATMHQRTLNILKIN